MKTVLLARHGESEWNEEDRVQGWAPTGLTDKGRKESRALGEFLSDQYDIDRIYTSDLQRTRETVAEMREDALAEVTAQEDIRWREQDLGVYQGMEVERFQEMVDDPEEADPTEPLRDGEAILDVRKRTVQGLENLFESEETILIVTHSGPIKQIIGHLRGLEPFEAHQQIDVDNCSLHVLEMNGDIRLAETNLTHFHED